MRCLYLKGPLVIYGPFMREGLTMECNVAGALDGKKVQTDHCGHMSCRQTIDVASRIAVG